MSNNDTPTPPPPPEKPSANECCGSGCTPCIFDYYYQEVEEWESKYGSLQKYFDAQKALNDK